jgi:recombinational DNA repair ATPase RecF
VETVFKLKHLHIKRFRNVKPGTRLDFADGFNVLLGKNGAGKTTLLLLLEAIATSTACTTTGSTSVSGRSGIVRPS